MNIIDHLSIGVSDIAQATEFYDGLMKTLGYKQLAKSDNFIAYGITTIQFLVMKPLDGEVHTPGNGTHICFRANGRESVNAFHAFAVANKGECAGEPGERPGYPIPDVYTTFVRDPFGHKLEAIFNGFN